MTRRLILACLLAALPAAPGWPAPLVPMARLEGRVVEVDGRPARGFQVHLIGQDGAETARAETDPGGAYSFDAVPAGRYGLAVADRAGRIAPVSGPPLRLPAGQSARRDLKLLRAESGQRQRSLAANYSVGRWWSGLSTHAKAWIAVAVVVGAWFTYEAFTEEDDRTEAPASPS